MGLIKKVSGCSQCQPAKTVNVSPDMSGYRIGGRIQVGACTVMQVQFPHCTNFEGVKILVYKGEVPAVIDPHFCDDHISPIARFVPTEEGWKMAVAFAEIVK